MIRIVELEASNRSKDMELKQLSEQVASLQKEHDNVKAQLEDGHMKSSHSNKAATSLPLSNVSVSDAHSWWGYVWHELKKMDNYGVGKNGSVLNLTSLGGTSSDFAVVEARFKDAIRQQAIELANVRQVRFHDHNCYGE